MSDEAMTRDIRQLHHKSRRAPLSPQSPSLSVATLTAHSGGMVYAVTSNCPHRPGRPSWRRTIASREGCHAGDLPRTRGKEDWGQELACPEWPPGWGAPVLHARRHGLRESSRPPARLADGVTEPNTNGGISLVTWPASEQQYYDAGPGPCGQPQPLSPNKLKVCK